jgi:hypothetical protein
VAGSEAERDWGIAGWESARCHEGQPVSDLNCTADGLMKWLPKDEEGAEERPIPVVQAARSLL